MTRDRKPATLPIEAASRLSFRAAKTRDGLNTSTAVRGTHPSAADLDYQQAVYVELPLQPSGVRVANRCFVRLSILLARIDI